MTDPTARELQCLDYATRPGGSTVAAARALGISPNTVHQHLSSLYRKLGVQNRAEAVRAVSGWRKAA